MARFMLHQLRRFTEGQYCNDSRPVSRIRGWVWKEGQRWWTSVSSSGSSGGWFALRQISQTVQCA